MRTKTFLGGYSFRRFAGQPNDTIVSLEAPSSVIVPLAQGFGTALSPIVKVGDIVEAGQIIARDDDRISSPIHSPINGKVVDIKNVNYFAREVAMVVIEGNGLDKCCLIEGYSENWNKLQTEKIEEILYSSGATSLDREGIPTRFKSSIINPDKVEDLIIHGVGSEAYNSSLEVFLNGKGLFRFVEGIKILKKIMPQATVHLALNKEKKIILERAKKLTSNLDKFKLHSVVPKYPQGYDEVLVPTLLNKKFPYGYSAANVGIVVLKIQADNHVFEAVTMGKNVIEREIALCGPCFKENVHVKAKVGTSLEFILNGRLRDNNVRIVLNSLLTGPEIDDLSIPIDRTFSQIIALPNNKKRELFAFMRPGFRKDSHSRAFASHFLNIKKSADTNLCGEERPCIQCGYCAEVCPVRVIPNLLYRYYKSGVNETLMRYGIFNCIDCNLCTYVCPSKIPLSKCLKDAKARLIESGCDHSLCILPRFNLMGLKEYKGVKVTR